jgi:transposase
MREFIRIGVDLSKGFFQVHALEREGSPALKRKLSRARFLSFFAGLAPSRIGMEACGSAHHWGRELRAMGHEVVLMGPAYVKPYLKRGKNDANDAAAICEAMSRPEMRFVPVKSADQQATLMLHKTRALMVKQRTMAVNALRGHLAEFGLIAAKGIHKVKDLIALAEADERLPEAARAAVAILAAPVQGLDASIKTLETKIAAASASCPMSRQLDEAPGFGPLIASAMVAFHPDPQVFRSAGDFAASIGVTPGQHSSGGKAKLGSITKAGNRYLRTMLVIGCTSVVRVAHKHKGALAEWIVAMRARKPERVVAVALANKMARIAWAMMTTGESFRKELYARA